MAAGAQMSHHKKWHDRYPELGTGPISIEPYISREYFEKERERIFRKVWLNVGRVEQIPQPGDYFVKDLKLKKKLDAAKKDKKEQSDTGTKGSG